jgi:hypothetical protein
VIVGGALSDTGGSTRQRFAGGHRVIQEPNGAPGDRNACAQARVPLPESVRIVGIR